MQEEKEEEVAVRRTHGVQCAKTMDWKWKEEQTGSLLVLFISVRP
jgi:hypothetical protein